MHRTASLLALLACFGLGPHAAEGAPQRCDQGSFVVAGEPLLPNPDFEPPDRVVLRDGTLSLASGCPPVPVELVATRRGTWLRARWRECSGVAEGVELKARVQPGCGELTGRLRSASPPGRRRFTAVREAEGRECDFTSWCRDGELCELPTGVCASALDRGTCVEVPSACPELSDPVCGCDGQTYGNDCERRAAGAQKSHHGACAVCQSACDCYARFELRDDCPLLCPNCGSFWTCDDGQCVEGCGFIPLPPCERLCTSNDDCAPEDSCRKPPGACDGAGSCEPRSPLCPHVARSAAARFWVSPAMKVSSASCRPGAAAARTSKGSAWTSPAGASPSGTRSAAATGGPTATTASDGVRRSPLRTKGAARTRRRAGRSSSAAASGRSAWRGSRWGRRSCTAAKSCPTGARGSAAVGAPGRRSARRRSIRVASLGRTRCRVSASSASRPAQGASSGREPPGAPRRRRSPQRRGRGCRPRPERAHARGLPCDARRAGGLEDHLGLARALEARFVVFQCPASFVPTECSLADLRRFFGWAERGRLRLGFEPRRAAWGNAFLRGLCRELDLVHVVDPFERRPVHGAPRYFRLHEGPGYGHRGAELRCLRHCCTARLTYCPFDSQAMRDDARRFRRLVG